MGTQLAFIKKQTKNKITKRRTRKERKIMIKSRIRYGTTVSPCIEVPNYNMGDCNATNLTGLAINGDMGYCTKRNNSVNKATIYTIEGINSAKPEIKNHKIINFATYGMTIYQNYLYIVSKSSTIVKVSAAEDVTTCETFRVKANGSLVGVQAIAHYKDNQFILMANSLSTDPYLCFLTGTFSSVTKEFEEKDRFYVKNTSGFTQFQDIHYSANYGLFIIINKMVNGSYTASNMILRAEIDSPTELNYNAKKLYNPVAEYKFNGKASAYSQLNAESLGISSDGRMYVATNLVPAAESTGKFTTDGIFFIGNIKFKEKDPMEINIYCTDGVYVPDVSVTVGSNKYTCVNPGGFALNGVTGYCLKTHTSGVDLKNKGSVLLSSANVDTTAFTAVSKNTILTTMGHGNGMTYYKGNLYVAAYDRATGRREIAKLSTDGKLVATYQCDDIIGGIAHYNNDSFIVVDYTKTGKLNYAYKPLFHIGHFTSDRFVKDQSFSVINPSYSTADDVGNVLQDIHYDYEHGLFFITLTDSVDRIYRVTPEQIRNAKPGVDIMPKEMYLPGTAVNEVESLSISNNGNNGLMYFSENASKNNDWVKKVQTFNFYKDTF